MKTILIVIGTRPEAIKMASVIHAIKKADDTFKLVTCVTGQHREILDQMLTFFEIQPDIDLQLMTANQTLADLTAKAIRAISATIEEIKPDITLVQGDTTTAMVAGLASFYAKVPVGHVEAGLRTDQMYDPFPEEINRRLLSSLASFHFAPTPLAATALQAEGHKKKSVFITGNTVVDALLWAAPRVVPPSLGLTLDTSRYILVTAHRRENFGEPIRNICAALKSIVEENEIDIIYPVHPNPAIKETVYSLLSNTKRIHLIDPLDYQDFIAVMKDAVLLLTDSGGVQEEAPSLGKPVLVLRKTTERPEAVDAGVAKLIGTNTSDIIQEVELLLHNSKTYQAMAQASNPFGDGSAADQIVTILKSCTK